MHRCFLLGLVATLSACGGDRTEGVPADGNEQVRLRGLADTSEAAPAPAGYRIEGDLIPTPSDTGSTFHHLRTRRAISGQLISIVRQQRGDRVVYARTETDCANALFHVLGVGGSRGEVEADQAYDGPLRPVEGLPLRRELASYICERAGTPLPTAG